MTIAPRDEEGVALSNLRAMSEGRGLVFHLNPPAHLLPSFLSGYQPDAIALRPGGGGIIIEVKPRSAQSSDKRLADISKLVFSQKGWEFKVIYVNPDTERATTLPLANQEQIAARLHEAEELADAGHPVAAFLLGWSIIEAAARLALAGNDASRFRGFSALQAVQTLAAEGLLESGVAEELRNMVGLRNAAVHGDLGIDIGTEQAKKLITHVRTLLDEMQRAA